MLFAARWPALRRGRPAVRLSLAHLSELALGDADRGGDPVACAALFFCLAELHNGAGGWKILFCHRALAAAPLLTHGVHPAPAPEDSSAESARRPR